MGMKAAMSVGAPEEGKEEEEEVTVVPREEA